MGIISNMFGFGAEKRADDGNFPYPQEVDFNFPQDVSKDAIKDLDRAARAGDGNMVVNALVRYGLAQSSVSADNLPVIVDRIEQTLAKEKRPTYRALLHYLEALVFHDYCERYVSYGRHNAPDEKPNDYTEWDENQFQIRIDSLLNEALSDPQALIADPVSAHKGVLIYSEQGALEVPTLFEFLSRSAIKLTQNRQLSQKFTDQWVELTKGKEPAHVFAMVSSRDYSWSELCKQYEGSEHQGIILNTLNGAWDTYDILANYVKAYPNAFYTPAIKNKVTSLEYRSAQVSYPEYVSSTDPIKVVVNATNVDQVRLLVYDVTNYKKVDSYIELKGLKPIATHEVSVVSDYPEYTPHSGKAQYELPPLKYGLYIIVPQMMTPQGKWENDERVYRSQALAVTDLALFLTNCENATSRVFAVDSRTGKPQQGVTISLEKGESPQITDAQGGVDIDKMLLRGYFSAQRGDDKFAHSVGFNQNYYGAGGTIAANVFTDLGVYRPGETVKMAAILYYADRTDRKAVAGRRLDVEFRDSNNEPIKTQQATTDDYGRIECSFDIPTDRMNGTFSLIVREAEGSKQRYAWHNVEVSEYKTPTFFVEFIEPKMSFVKGANVHFEGKVETYSGMPVANTELDINLKRNEWSWRWWMRGEGIVMNHMTVTTDAQGRFTIDYKPDIFEENKRDTYWAINSYEVKVSCTDAAGETHDESTSFIIGTRRGLEFTNNDIQHVNDKPLTLPLVYNTTDDTQPVTQCYYTVTDSNDQQVASGNFATDKPVVDFTKLPSGQYSIKVHILADAEREDNDKTASIILYRLTDKTAPVADKPLWIPKAACNVDDRNMGHIIIGSSSPEAHIYYVAVSRTAVVKEGWLHYNPGMHELTIAVPDVDDENLKVYFVTTYKGETIRDEVYLKSQVNARKLLVKVTSFRDKLVPGERERWTMQLVDKNGTPQQGALLLEMYDKAISTIQANPWSFSPTLRYHSPFALHTVGLTGRNNLSHYWQDDKVNINRIVHPELFVYGENFFSYAMGRYDEVERLARPMMAGGARVKQSEVLYSSAAVDTYNAEEDADIMLEEVSLNEQPVEVNQAALDKVTMRENDVKTALWMPMLTTDANGNIAIEFEVPNFNTTWLLQAIGYDSRLYTDVLNREVVTQRPLMVKSALPRFVRQGDCALLSARVQNATDEATKADAVVEIFDPRTNQVVASKTFNLNIEPRGTAVVSLPWTVTDSLAVAGFRIKASNGNYGDGEQVLLPVLENISPVIETKPFYVEAGTPHFELDLPEFPAGARVTLEYCDNPVWYCVTALPSIFDENCRTSSSLAHSLFALEVARGIANDRPQMAEAIDYWKANAQDSMMVSMLERNADLKIGTLLASPWLDDAQRQTLRMTRAHELFDPATTSKHFERIVASLHDLQMPDGGFTWFKYPLCESSLYTTEEVLELVGEIKHLGYLPDDSQLNEMMSRAVKYYDNEYLKILSERKKDKVKDLYAGFSTYVYVRTLFADQELSRDASKLFKEALKTMNKNWSKGLSLGEKAYYAIALNRNGYQPTAQRIVESIRQFAIHKPQLGTYWDNLQVGWRYFDKVAVTAVILEAMNECDPRQDEIDDVRKWMLLMKQTNDWGSSSLAADAVYALLSTGSEWLENNAEASVSVAGQQVSFDRVDRYLGYCRKTIDASSTGQVVIDRSGNSPAWGAVYTQFVAPMTTIDAVAIDEISIVKGYYTYDEQGKLQQADHLKVGDRVQVRLVIKNNRDLDFVTVNDERGSCFEPVDQLSDYRYDDRLYYYLEVKDASTRMFFTSLPKGTHVVSYDVFVTAPGEYAAGIATAQCQYAPQITAHSAGNSIKVSKE